MLRNHEYSKGIVAVSYSTMKQSCIQRYEMVDARNYADNHSYAKTIIWWFWYETITNARSADDVASLMNFRLGNKGCYFLGIFGINNNVAMKPDGIFIDAVRTNYYCEKNGLHETWRWQGRSYRMCTTLSYRIKLLFRAYVQSKVL